MMNPAAAMFFRACRAPQPRTRLFRPRQSSQLASTAIQGCTRTPHAPFSSSRCLPDAQPIESIPSEAKSTTADELPSTIITRAATDTPPSTSARTSTNASTTGRTITAAQPRTTTSPKNPSTPTPDQTATADDDAAFLLSNPILTGTVSRLSTRKTVHVRSTKQHLHPHLRTHFNRPVNYRVHDAAEILAVGDVVRFSLFAPGARAARDAAHRGASVRHVLREVVTPFGTPVEGRVSRAAAFAEEDVRQRAGMEEAERKREKAAARRKGKKAKRAQ